MPGQRYSGRYNFGSEGAAGYDALQEELMRRDLARRQALLDERAQQEEEENRRIRSADLKLRQDREARDAAEQRETRTNLEHERDFRRASTISENALPGDPVDAETKALLDSPVRIAPAVRPSLPRFHPSAYQAMVNAKQPGAITGSTVDEILESIGRYRRSR